MKLDHLVGLDQLTEGQEEHFKKTTFYTGKKFLNDNFFTGEEDILELKEYLVKEITLSFYPHFGWEDIDRIAQGQHPRDGIYPAMENLILSLRLEPLSSLYAKWQERNNSFK